MVAKRGSGFTSMTMIRRGSVFTYHCGRLLPEHSAAFLYYGDITRFFASMPQRNPKWSRFLSRTWVNKAVSNIGHIMGNATVSSLTRGMSYRVSRAMR